MKYFAVSDIHGFATELKEALFQAGFDINNEEHTLIVAGDLWDRSSEALETYEFIKSIPSSRRILIRGNHENLFLDLLENDYPERHDFQNKTVDTFCQIAGMTTFNDTPMDDYLKSGLYERFGTFYDTTEINGNCQELWNTIREKVNQSEIKSFLCSDEWKNYYELDRFIFVHSFIPLKDSSMLPGYYLMGHEYSYRPDWREASVISWEDATWGCPYQLYQQGLFDEEKKNGKTLVCGHWHTSDFYSMLNNDFTYYHLLAPVYYSEHIIGLDGGVIRNQETGKFEHPQNVLVIDEEFNCFDKYGNKLN